MNTYGHSRSCAAEALMCAVENIRDAEAVYGFTNADVVPFAEGYLQDGMMSCDCLASTQEYVAQMSELAIPTALALGYPAASGGIVTQAHANYCQANGHATHTVHGASRVICPRCGDSRS